MMDIIKQITKKGEFVMDPFELEHCSLEKLALL